MNTDTNYLKTIAEEIAANTTPNLSGNKPNHHLEREALRLEEAIIQNLHIISNFTQRDTFHFNTLSKLVNICDILFEASNSVDADVTVLINLLAHVKEILPDEIRPNLKLPKAFVVIQEAVLLESWSAHLAELKRHGVDPRLIEIAGIPFKRFTLANYKLYWRDFTWLKGYLAKLEMMDWENPDCSSKIEAMMSLLIGRDFNDDRFYVYCKKYVIERAKVADCKRTRLLALAACEKLVLQDTQIGMPSFDLRGNSISTRLIKWIKEEIDFVETHEREQSFTKLRFNLYTNRIAFFFKLLSEQKVFGDTSFKELAQQIASTCLSEGGEDILQTTIISKAYPKDRKTLEEMESLLVKMLEYLRSFRPTK
ncbi:MAG: hypothetical protein JSU01_03100 [Bacteroidetes bacterium]|nr:hypothetical protein [Bacteroidota bacterium]